jgi:uncharacterized membrane protein YbaN (DUF454 family)
MLGKTVKKGLWLAGGIVCLTLAIIGLLLPIVPQVPFFIASIFCFVRCSERFNNWLSQHPWFIRFQTLIHISEPTRPHNST